MTVAVVGGGITGLATGLLLHEAGVPVVVLEATRRLGGKILTRRFGEERLDVGADAFLARRPHALRLARRVGLADELVAPATGRVRLWTGGRLVPLPGGTVMGVPGDLPALARSGVLSARGLARAAVEILLPRQSRAGDVAVGRLVEERFGREVVERLVEPLLGGVYAGSVDRLSLEAAAGPLREAAARHRSLLLGVRAVRADADGGGPVFLTPRGGMGALVDALAERLGERVRTGAEVRSLEPTGDGWRLSTGREALEADEVVLTVPAPVAARLLQSVAAEAAALLTGIAHASVATITLGYDPTALPGIPRGSGMLVPRAEGRLVKAVTWTSSKWPHHVGGDRWWMRASVGRIGDTAPLALDDDVLADRVGVEVAEAMGLEARPRVRAVTRWPDALPQHEVGHLDRVARIRADLPESLHVAGAAYDGIGVTSCVAQAERLATELAGRVRSRLTSRG